MSSFNQNQNAMRPTALPTNDSRTADVIFPCQSPRGQKYPWEDGMLWPSSRSMGNGMLMVSEDASVCAVRWSVWAEEAGNAARKKLNGITRDSASAALGSVTVQAIRADGSSKDGSAVSDSSGYYEIPVANPSGAYKVDAYKAGSPDVAGTTVNTLVPI